MSQERNRRELLYVADLWGDDADVLHEPLVAVHMSAGLVETIRVKQ